LGLNLYFGPYIKLFTLNPFDPYGYDRGLFQGLVLGGIFAAFMTCLIVKSFYDSNGGQWGKNFIAKLLALSWVTHIRLTLISLPLLLVFLMAYRVQPNLGIILLVIFSIGNLYYFVSRINKSLQEIYQNGQ
jgi:hypothetical protein